MNLQHILEYSLFNIGTYQFTLAKVVGVFFVWLVTWLFLRLLHRILHRKDSLLSISDGGRRHSLYLIIQYVVWVMAGTMMLEVVGIHVTVLLAGSAALLVGLGLGIQDIFRDIMSGIFLLFEGTIEVNDILVIDQTVGKVSEINLRTSKVVTREGNILIIPNSKFITQTVYNWSHRDNWPSRFQVAIGTDYSAPADQVKEVILKVADTHPDILKDDPARQPTVRLQDFAEEKMLFDLIFWTYRKFDVDDVRSELRFQIRRALTEAGISMDKIK
jgi:small-conductance mechanosensitive channel